MERSGVRTYRVYQVDSFTRSKLKGNPAGVVPEADGLAAGEMQALARELNNSETAFIFPPDAPDHDVRVRFFTPTKEVPICGHATIAAHYLRAVEQRLPATTVRQKSGVGILPVEVVREGNDYRIVMTQTRPQFLGRVEGPSRVRMLAALGLGEADLDSRCPVEHVNTGHSKVIVGVKSGARLNSLAPDMKLLREAGEEIGCSGYFVFTFDSDDAGVLTRARMFAPQIGIDEDPVTGNGNGPLGAYLVKNRLTAHDGRTLSFRGRQGEAIGREGVAHVEVEIEDGLPAKVKVGGEAVVVFRTEISL